MQRLRRKGSEVAVATLNDQGEGRFSLEGELSFASVPLLLRRGGALFAGQGAIAVDLAGVHRADSAGLALLVEWLVQAQRLKRQLSFKHVPDQIMRMARVGGLEDILPL